MALSWEEAAADLRPVDVDDLTITLALLHLLTIDLPDTDPLVGVSDRLAERLRSAFAARIA